MSNSTPATLQSIDGKRKRDTYVSWPPPELIKKHKDFWAHGDLEISPYDKDLLFFKLASINTVQSLYSKEQSTTAMYREVAREEYQSISLQQAAAASAKEQLYLMEQAQMTAKYKQDMWAQQAKISAAKPVTLDDTLDKWQPSSYLANATSAPLAPWWDSPAKKPEAPPEPPKPEPQPEPSIPDPFVPKRRMMR